MLPINGWPFRGWMLINLPLLFHSTVYAVIHSCTCLFYMWNVYWYRLQTFLSLFKESNVIIVHLLGAFMAFAIGFIYCVCQTVISYKIDDAVEIPGNTLFLKRFRAVLCVVDFCFLVICILLDCVPTLH